MILIGTRQKINHHNVTVHISGQVLSLLTQVPYIKYLCVSIDQNLIWQKRSENVLQRTRGKALYDSNLFQLYCGFILPILDYCDTVWASPSALLSKSAKQIHASFVCCMYNNIGFVKDTLTEYYHFHTIVQVHI